MGLGLKKILGIDLNGILFSASRNNNFFSKLIPLIYWMLYIFSACLHNVSGFVLVMKYDMIANAALKQFSIFIRKYLF